MDELEKLLSENLPSENKEKGRWKMGRYDTSKDIEMQKWEDLKSLLRYNGDDNSEVKNRLDNLSRNVKSGILEIRKVKSK